MEITDSISEALMKTVMKYARVLTDNPSDYKARAEIMWAGSLAHNGLTGCGTDGGDWASHNMEHELEGCLMWHMEPDLQRYGGAGRDM